MRPTEHDYAPYYEKYVSLVPEDDILSALEDQSTKMQKLLSSIDDDRAETRYDTGKWSIKEVIGHITDVERVFGYRALAIGRGETKPLPGIEQDVFTLHAKFDQWSLGDLAESYALVRRANIVMFRNFSDEDWDRRGIASDNAVTVRALAWIIVGHDRHHVSVLRERYGVGASAT